MKIGQVVENAMWVTGDESDAMVDGYKRQVETSITLLCDELGFIHGPVLWKTLRPEDDRVPEVPDHIQGQQVRLLVGESVVLARKPVTPVGSFVANLDRVDLERLRILTRRASGHADMTDAQCDEVIEQLGPEAAVDGLRKAVNTGAI